MGKRLTLENIRTVFSIVREQIAAALTPATAGSAGMVKPGDGLAVDDTGTLSIQLTEQMKQQLKGERGSGVGLQYATAQEWEDMTERPADTIWVITDAQ